MVSQQLTSYELRVGTALATLQSSVLRYEGRAEPSAEASERPPYPDHVKILVNQELNQSPTTTFQTKPVTLTPRLLCTPMGEIDRSVCFERYAF